MTSLRQFASRLAALFRKRRLEQELNDEVRAHVDMLIEANVQRGMSRAEARFAALREFGGVEQTKEIYRDQRGLPMIETLWQDLRYGMRQLRRSPGFTLVAALTLALGIGANTAIFSVLDTVLLRPLPYRHPSELILVTETLPQLGLDEVGVAAQEYLDYRDRNRSFSQVGSFEDEGFNLTGSGQPLRVNAAAVSASVFPLLGVSPVLGRTFTDEEDRYGASKVVVISRQLWEHEYGSDPQILGKTIKLDETPYTVIGVMPASFRFPFDGKPLSEMADLWVPEAFSPARLDPKERTKELGVGLIGRLKAGVTEAQAREDMNDIAAAFQKQNPNYSGTIRVEPHTYAFAAYTVAKAKPLVVLLIMAVACVLLIACANVANLLLARASQRSREMAIRAAVGAHRARLLRQLLVESLLLSLLGALVGVLLAGALVVGLRDFGPPDVPRLREVALHAIALLATIALSLITGVLFGFVPAWRLSHVSPYACLKESAQAGTARANRRLQNAVAVCEIALAMVLLVAGGLLLRSLARLLTVPLGFEPKGAVVVRTLFDRARYPDPARRDAVQQELLKRLAYIPGVSAVAAASHLPLSDNRQIGFRLEHAAEDDFHWAENSLVSPGYFRAMGISVIRGRDFAEQDRRSTPNVAIINETLARQYFRGQDPIGQRFNWGGRALFTIVGIAEDVHISALDADPPPMIYNSMFQVESGASGRTALIVRSRVAEAGLFDEISKQVWSLDKDLPLYNTTTLATLVEESLAQRRFTLLLLGGFAGMALLLAVVGLFGVVSYMVAERQHEIGIRMALGAERSAILRMVLERGTALGLAGCGSGLLISLLSSRLLVANLYHISRFDPVTLILVPVLLFGVALFASWIPARRATRVDPMVALRYE
ncbi:MAG: ABC transporter permease [Terriglobia bacterium]|jgi:predicted permease